MVQSKEILINYLEDLQAQGHTHVSVEPEAREILVQWYKAGKQGKKTGQKIAKETTMAELDKPLFAQSQFKTKEQAKPINYLFALQAAQPNLTWTDSHYVAAAQLVIISEKPLAAAQSKKLNQILGAMGLSVDTVSLVSLYKQEQAVITAEYTELSLGLLAQELQQNSHKVILSLGQELQQTLAKHEWLAKQEIQNASIDIRELITADKDLAIKRQFWVRMLNVMNALQLPISEKQQGYFK